MDDTYDVIVLGTGLKVRVVVVASPRPSTPPFF